MARIILFLGLEIREVLLIVHSKLLTMGLFLVSTRRT